MQRTLLLKRRLTPNKGEGDRAQVMCYGDVHWGASTCEVEHSLERLEYAVKHGVYVLGMGDLLECALVGGKSDTYSQKLTPEEQIEAAVKNLKPVADAGLLLGLIQGNHEARIQKMTSVNVTKLICQQLGVPYLDHSCFCLLYVGKQSYTIFATHGSSGARMAHSKLRIALDQFKHNGAEILLHGHVHSLDHMTQLYREVDKAKGTVVERVRHVVLTGHFLGYRGSYAECMDLPPSKTGSPMLNLYASEHTVRVVI